MKRVICFFSVLLLTPMLLAIPYSAMGNINIPDAYCLPHLMMEISYVNFFTKDGVVPDDPDPYDKYDFAANFRIGLYDRLEIGLVYASTAGLYGNLKVKLISETETLPAISFGLLNIITEVKNGGFERYDYPDAIDYVWVSPFGMLSKSIVIITGIPALEFIETTFHAGLGARRFLGRGQYSRYMTGVFLGLDVKPARYWGFSGEIDGQDLNLGLNIYFKNFTIQTAMYHIEDFMGSKGNKFAVNLQYTLDKFSEKKASEKRKKLQTSRYMSGNTVPGSGDSYYDGTNPLLDELEQIRERRKQAEKELEEIRKLLQE
ncbi:MAG: hypothetical protein Q7J16_07815 [Candidatus Cloacimonadales bacterium]|nr:hypothetical protein [Candidatus Cloacimonadales bacterium]